MQAKGPRGKRIERQEVTWLSPSSVITLKNLSDIREWTHKGKRVGKNWREGREMVKCLYVPCLILAKSQIKARNTKTKGCNKKDNEWKELASYSSLSLTHTHSLSLLCFQFLLHSIFVWVQLSPTSYSPPINNCFLNVPFISLSLSLSLSLVATHHPILETDANWCLR